jgi:hypothetical protein
MESRMTWSRIKGRLNKGVWTLELDGTPLAHLVPIIEGGAYIGYASYIEPRFDAGGWHAVDFNDLGAGKDALQKWARQHALPALKRLVQSDVDVEEDLTDITAALWIITSADIRQATRVRLEGRIDEYRQELTLLRGVPRADLLAEHEALAAERVLRDAWRIVSSGVAEDFIDMRHPDEDEKQAKETPHAA